MLKNLKFNFKAETAFSMELLYQGYFSNLKITEVPTTWVGRQETKFRLSKRGPKYFKIFFWGLENRLRENLGLNIRRFYND